jgi:phosphatidylserine synthase 2
MMNHPIHVTMTPCDIKQRVMTSSILQTVFYQTHYITLLLSTLIALTILGVRWGGEAFDTVNNVKRGLAAVGCMFCIVGCMQIRNGTFVRPHPVFWRLVLMLMALYQLLLVFALFQHVDDIRHWLTFYDASLGRPLPEKSYAIDCSLTWTNIQVSF